MKKNYYTLFSDDVEKVDNVADMMTSTYPQAASKNGGHMEGHMNGGQNTTTTTNGSGSLLASDCTGAVVVGTDSTNIAITADTSLKCLEEPSFEFEASIEAKKNSEAAPTLASAAVKKPSYRVLEDPYAEAPLEAAAASKGPKAPNYRVLEDPMTTAMYDPSTSSEAVSASAVTSAMPGSSRPPASEVLEGAREKFDKFWGSKPRNNTTSDNNEP
mgnify:CR=1 FL=1